MTAPIIRHEEGGKVFPMPAPFERCFIRTEGIEDYVSLLDTPNVLNIPVLAHVMRLSYAETDTLPANCLNHCHEKEEHHE